MFATNEKNRPVDDPRPATSLGEGAPALDDDFAGGAPAGLDCGCDAPVGEPVREIEAPAYPY